MIKCDFCKAEAFRFKDGWARLSVTAKGKQKIQIVGCPKHAERAFVKFGKILDKLPDFRANIKQ